MMARQALGVIQILASGKADGRYRKLLHQDFEPGAL